MRFLRGIKNLVYRVVRVFVHLLFFFFGIAGIKAVARAFFFLPMTFRTYGVRKIFHMKNEKWAAMTWSVEVAKGSENPRLIQYAVWDLLIVKDFAAAADMVREGRLLQGDFDDDEWYRKFLNDVDLILYIESHGYNPSLESSLWGSRDIADHFYRRAWEWHPMEEKGKLVEALNIYLAASGWDQDRVIHVSRNMLRQHQAWDAISKFYKRAADIVRSRIPPDSRRNDRRQANTIVRRLDSLRLSAQTLSGTSPLKFDEALVRAAEKKAEFQPVLAMARALAGDPEAAGAHLTHFVYSYARNEYTESLFYQAMFLLAVAYEEDGDFETAKILYRFALQGQGIEYYMSDVAYRYFSLCMAMGDYGEGLYILREAHKIIWRIFARYDKRGFLDWILRSRPVDRDFKNNRLIPKSSTLFLGGKGIGDEILRLAILQTGMSPNTGYGYVCDRRIKDLVERSMPNVRIYSPSRFRGIYAVSEIEYWRDRDGIDYLASPLRVDRSVYDAMKDYKKVRITEDLFVHFVKNRAEYKPASRKLFTPTRKYRTAVRKWLETLPAGRLNVAFAWRSGSRNAVRDKSYTEITQWQKILSMPGINFIPVQYSNIDDEIALVKNEFGVELHKPEFDLMNDFESLVALFAQTDLLITPGTAVRETGGASGARTWSLTTTPLLPDHWRIGPDKKTDVIFPSIEHITALEFGGREGVLEEVARRLETMTAKKRSVA